YRVGFLGTSQAGKSTTFNNVLQEQIAQGGIGDATTSTITRSYRIPARSDGPRKFLLRYLTYDQYMDRPDRLCKPLYILNSSARSPSRRFGVPSPTRRTGPRCSTARRNRNKPAPAEPVAGNVKSYQMTCRTYATSYAAMTPTANASLSKTAR